MGLLRDTLKAIINIDKALSTPNIRSETMKTSPSQARKEIPAEHTVDLRFAYPECRDFGTRLRAVRLFTGRKPEEFGAAIGLTEDQVFNLVRGKLAPWPALYCAVSLRWSIDEHWLATGMRTPVDPVDRASEAVTQCVQRNLGMFDPEPAKPIPLSALFGKEKGHDPTKHG